MNSQKTFEADRGDAGQRLDLVLRRRLADVEGVTRTRLQRWIDDGRVHINDRTVRRVAARVSAGDVVSVALPEQRARLRMEAEPSQLEVLYEDDAILAVNKPAGIVVHPTYGHGTATLMNALLWHARTWPAGLKPSLVGRLDKQTSGVVLVAKARAIHAALQKTLTSSRSEKTYLAVVYGRVRKARGRIELSLGRASNDRRRVVVDPDGAPSVTLFERLDLADAPPIGLSLLSCRLMTGRMHQIRVHLAASGWPIVGDQKYGSAEWRKIREPALAAVLQRWSRQALHAWHLSFAHPITQARITIHASLPSDFVSLLTVTGLRRPVE
jgi:23S rRNA pseudouridine1911/1915/1917 synthase